MKELQEQLDNINKNFNKLLEDYRGNKDSNSEALSYFRTIRDNLNSLKTKL